MCCLKKHVVNHNRVFVIGRYSRVFWGRHQRPAGIIFSQVLNVDRETFIELSALWNPYPSSAGPSLGSEQQRGGLPAQCPPKRHRKRERRRWSEEESAEHNDGESGKKVYTRYRQRQISPVSDGDSWMLYPASLQIRTCTLAVFRQFVKEIITFWSERAPRHSEVELKSSAKFLPLEFGFLCLETYASYTILDWAHARLYFLNQTPTGM